MTIAFSRTGISPMRMQAAAQEILVGGSTGNSALTLATSVAQLNCDSDQIAHALRLIRDTGGEVSILTTDLRCSFRTRIRSVGQNAVEIRICLAHCSAADEAVLSGPLILSGRLLGRPLVCAIHPAALGDSAEFRIGSPAWMLLAEQRNGCRVRIPGCRLATSWGEMAEVVDLSESGIALATTDYPPAPVLAGVGWSGLLIHDDLKGANPVVMTTIHRRPQGISGMYIGARLNIGSRPGRAKLRQLIGRHVDLFGDT